MKTASKVRKSSELTSRITVTFQPTESAQRFLAVAERANLNRSELLNTLIEKHLPSLLREQVSEIEDALKALKQLAA